MHRHDEIEMGLPTGGSVTALFGSQRVRLHDGQFGVFWANQPHGPIRVDAGTRAEVILVPLAWVLGWNLPPNLVYRLLRGEVILAPETCSSPLPDVNLVRHWVELMRMGTPEAQRIVLLEVQARLLRISMELDDNARHPAPAPKQTALQAGEVSHFEHMARFMATHYQQQINVEHVAEAVRLHPKYAMRLFRRTCGVTMLEYLTQQRISHAQRLLATTDRKILDISEESGFQSPSRFYAVFVRLCGCAPAQYRNSLRTRLNPVKENAQSLHRGQQS
jgi:AraC family transcriptional regulator, melibiose operon regulatory protein